MDVFEGHLLGFWAKVEELIRKNIKAQGLYISWAQGPCPCLHAVFLFGLQ
jgi:hypothetical protein